HFTCIRVVNYESYQPLTSNSTEQKTEQHPEPSPSQHRDKSKDVKTSRRLEEGQDVSRNGGAGVAPYQDVPEGEVEDDWEEPTGKDLVHSILHRWGYTRPGAAKKHKLIEHIDRLLTYGFHVDQIQKVAAYAVTRCCTDDSFVPLRNPE